MIKSLILKEDYKRRTNNSNNDVAGNRLNRRRIKSYRLNSIFLIVNNALRSSLYFCLLVVETAAVYWRMTMVLFIRALMVRELALKFLTTTEWY